MFWTEEFPRIIAHRGASGYAPENTLSAIKKAWQLGIHCVEFDVMLAKCGEVIVFHDEKLSRVSKQRGAVINYTYQQLKEFDIGSKFSHDFAGESIPTLTEVLHFLVEHQMTANIEIKPLPKLATITATSTWKKVKSIWPASKPMPLYSSFNMAALQTIRSLDETANIALLFNRWHHHWLKYAEQLRCVALHFNYRALTAKRIAQIKQHHYKIACYTVDEPAIAHKLFMLGVDAIFTNFPDRFTR